MATPDGSGGDTGSEDARVWRIPPTLLEPGALSFWRAVLMTGLGAGVAATILTAILEAVQRLAWSAPFRGSPVPMAQAVAPLGLPASAVPDLSGTLLGAAILSPAWRHVVVLLAAGLLTGVGQIVLRRLASGNGIDTTAAIWFAAGRLPALRTLGSALLSVVAVAMGASLGREGAAKQAGAVVANWASDRETLSDEQRRLLVACGTGAGMAAAYGVPLGGALFALEVMRGVLALRMVLPAMVTSLIAATVALIALPDRTTYVIPAYRSSGCIMAFALVCGPLLGLISVGYVRAIAWADRNRPRGWGRLFMPVLVLGAIGVLSITFPELLGNGRDIAQLAFADGPAPSLTLVLILVVLRVVATVFCLASGTPGGLFTPSLAIGALLGAVFGHAWSLLWPGVPLGLFAVVGATAILASTTQGPISSVVLMMELTGRDRSFIAPVLLAVALATLVSRTIEVRSVYDARLTDEQVAARARIREWLLGPRPSEGAPGQTPP